MFDLVLEAETIPMTITKIKLGTSPISKAEYLAQLSYARKFSRDDIGSSSVGYLYPDLETATVNLIDGGQTAWDVLEFEKHLYWVVRGWLDGGLYVRARLYADWLLTTVENPENYQWLREVAAGDFWSHLSMFGNKCPIGGHMENFLYPLQFESLLEAQCRRDANRVWVARNGERLAYQRFGFISD
jgi:hypothetical protein